MNSQIQRFLPPYVVVYCTAWFTWRYNQFVARFAKRDLLRIIYVICAWATSLNCEDNTVSLHTITRKHFSFTYCSLKWIYASLQLHNQIHTLDPNCISGHFWDLHKVAINFACEFCGCFIIPSLKISWMLLKTAIC